MCTGRLGYIPVCNRPGCIVVATQGVCALFVGKV